MGHITSLGVLQSAHPDTTAALSQPDAVLLLAVRWWVTAFKQDADPMPRLCQGLGIAGAPEAAYSIDSLMGIIARTGQRPLDIRCPRCPKLSDDERHLLHAAYLVQSVGSAWARVALAQHLLTEEGARFAIGPLEGVAVLFAQAGLIFREPSASGNAGPIAPCEHRSAAPTLH